MKSIRDILSKKAACIPLINIQGELARKYRLFMNFLRHNQEALRIMAEMEMIYFSGNPFSLTSVKRNYEGLLEAVVGSAYALNSLTKNRYSELIDVCGSMDRDVEELFRPEYITRAGDVVRPFEDITLDMKKDIGAKAAILATIKNELKLPVPHGFAVTAYAFERFMEENRLAQRIEAELSKLFSESLDVISSRLNDLILNAKMPQEIADEMLREYETIEGKTHKDVRLAMRSSAVGEDTEATFAGQYTTVLNVPKENIIDAYKTVLASKYSARAISYRLHYGLDDRDIPMCVAGVVMADSKASGVIYTEYPTQERSDAIKINSIFGLGEYLVEGKAFPDSFLVDKREKRIIKKEISRKYYRLVSLVSGGTNLTEVPKEEGELPSINDDTVLKLCEYGLALEDFFEGPQDIEWAIDGEGNLSILQCRPLHVPEVTYKGKGAEIKQEYPENPLILSGGETACPGIAVGKIFVLKDDADIAAIPDNSILVTKTASPHYARAMGRINGIITDIGSITSHLSSVAREFGVPALVAAGNATSLLKDGEVATLSAATATIYRGIVEKMVKDIRPAKRLIFESPVHQRMMRILDKISPLNLIDPEGSSFSPGGCRTFHDIIRFTHEKMMKEMFGLTEEAEEVRSVKLTATIPLILRLIDLGGGLKKGLTTCDTVTPEDIESIPMKAIWKGFTHPGINWTGTVNIDMKNIITLFTVSAASRDVETLETISYATISKEYMNLSAKFGYHFATIDTLCSENINQNYVSLQFSGGAGSYYGKSLRVSFLGNVLKNLGFKVSLKGDLIEAFISGYDSSSMEEKLDQMGRLLASSRLLDVSLSNQGDIETFTEAFFKGDYEFLPIKRDGWLKGFYTHGGDWKRAIEDGRTYCVQDGSRAGFSISSGLARIMGKLVGPALQDFLDNMGAFYYFPIAVAKDSEISDGAISVKVKPVSGNIDRAGGLAFGIRNTGNYFVLRINAIEDNVILFEYVNNRRIQRMSIKEKIESDKWYQIIIEVKGMLIKGYLDGRPVVEHMAGRPLKGFVGLWTKADSVIYFDDLTIQAEGRKRVIEF